MIVFSPFSLRNLTHQTPLKTKTSLLTALLTCLRLGVWFDPNFWRNLESFPEHQAERAGGGGRGVRTPLPRTVSHLRGLSMHGTRLSMRYPVSKPVVLLLLPPLLPAPSVSGWGSGGSHQTKDGLKRALQRDVATQTPPSLHHRGRMVRLPQDCPWIGLAANPLLSSLPHLLSALSNPLSTPMVSLFACGASVFSFSSPEAGWERGQREKAVRWAGAGAFGRAQMGL